MFHGSDNTHSTEHVLLKAHAQEFTDHLNSIDDDIKWMTEGKIITHTWRNEEENIVTRTERALAFFNTWLVINEDGSIKTKVYRKETHMDQYLHFRSNHPSEHQSGSVKTLIHRVDTIVSVERDKVEEKPYM